jgi:hypothetical protein
MVPIDELDASESETKTKGIEEDRDFEDEDEEQAFGRSNERVDLTKVQVNEPTILKESKVAN